VTVRAVDRETVADRLTGEVVRPDAADYDQARSVPVGGFEQVRPEAVVHCVDEADVAAAIGPAADSGLPVSIRGGGHSPAGFSTGDGIVLDLSGIRDVAVSAGTAVVGAGATLTEVYAALDAHVRTIPASCGPTVGIAGLALGGGFGILGRTYGLTCDQLIGARVVLAGGRIVECAEGQHDDLWWALRGAGGSRFGVVTQLTFRTVRSPMLTTFHLHWPLEAAVRAISSWQTWSPDGPQGLAAGLLLTAPAERDRGAAVHVLGAMQGPRERAVRLLQELVAAVGRPASEEYHYLPFHQAKQLLADTGPGDDRPGAHPLSRSEFFRRRLTEGAIDDLLHQFRADRVEGEARGLDFSPWGGAYNRPAPLATAFAHRRERFLLKHGVSVPADADPGQRQHARRWLQRSWTVVHPLGSGGVYPNFPEPDLDPWSAAYLGVNRQRLARLTPAFSRPLICNGGHFAADTAIPYQRTRGAPPAAQIAMPTYLVSRNSSIPSKPPSRPKPECFVPPNGAAGLDTMPWFSPTIPVSSPSATRNASPRSRV
jgi:hypothetical protein